MWMNDEEYIESVADEVRLYEIEKKDAKFRLQSEKDVLASDLSGVGGDDMMAKLSELEKDSTRKKMRLKWAFTSFLTRLKIMFG